MQHSEQSEGSAPLILTAKLDEHSFGYFDGMRKRHFPRSRNVIGAHLTLFHHLPGEQEDAIVTRLANLVRDVPFLTLSVTGLRFLGKGTAFEIASPPLQRLRAALAKDWVDWLTPQDCQGFRPHITIQNKVAPEQARRLFEDLENQFEPFEATSVGLDLWRYLGGPWERVRTFEFHRSPSAGEPGSLTG